MPPRAALVLLLAFACLPPFFAQATGNVVGSFTMFNRLERYHIELSTITPEGIEAVPIRTLARHLSPEARRILLPAEGYAVGADQVDLTVFGLTDLAKLLCARHPGALRARARLTRDPFDVARSHTSESQVDCGHSP
jgi:hypothetical protein